MFVEYQASCPSCYPRCKVSVSTIRFEPSFFQSKQENVRIKPNTVNLFLTKIPQSF